MPENWKTYKLEELTTRVTVGFVGSMAQEYVESGVPMLRSQNIRPFTLDYANLKYISPKFHKKISKSSLKEDDVAIVRTGNPGTACVIPEGITELNCSDLVIATPDKSKIDPHFLSFYFNSIARNYISSELVGAVQQHFNVGSAKKMKVKLPEIEEQHKIVSILKAIQDKIELNLQMNKTLEEMAMALYKHWFVDFGPFQDGEFVDSQLGEIPKGWKNAILGDLINLNPRLSLAKGSQASFVEMKVLPIDVMSVSDVAQKEFKGGAKFQNGDTLFARITPCLENGKTAFVDFLESGEIAFGSTEFLVMRAKEGVSKYWTYCLARDTNFRNFAISTMVGTSGRQRVQNDPFLSYEIPQPPKEVFDSFSEIAEPWFTQIRINTIENQTLTQLRDTLLPKLISGEVRVKDVEKTLSEVL